MKKIRQLLLIACVAVASFLPAVPADAAFPPIRSFPGANGRIAFARFTNERWRIFSMEQNGSGELRLTDRSMNSYTPAWSATGTKIVLRRRGEGQEGLWTMNTDGGHLRKVENTPWYCGFPGFSPDGSQIVYSNEKDGRIYVIDADGTGKTDLTGPGKNVAPVFSPDGTQIAFSSSRQGDAEIYVMDADGSHETALTDNALEDTYPDWSPDGLTLAFQRTRNSGDDEIYTIPVAGGAQVRLTNHAGDDRTPAWSPNGNKIAFAYDSGALDSEIYVMDAIGSNMTIITSNKANEYFPDWEPA